MSRALALAAQGGAAFLSVAPSLIGGVLKGAVLGALAMGALGVGLSLGAQLLWASTALPGWLHASLFLTPVVLGVAGVVVGGVRGLLGALARALVEKKLVAWTYARVKPVVVSVARRARGAKPEVVAELVREALAQTEQPAPGGAQQGLADRVLDFAVTRSRRLMALALVAHVARAKSGAEAVEELEHLGLQKLEGILVGSLEDLFAVKLNLIAAGAFALCLSPQVAFWLMT